MTYHPFAFCMWYCWQLRGALLCRNSCQSFRLITLSVINNIVEFNLISKWKCSKLVSHLNISSEFLISTAEKLWDGDFFGGGICVKPCVLRPLQGRAAVGELCYCHTCGKALVHAASCIKRNYVYIPISSVCCVSVSLYPLTDQFYYSKFD